MKKVAIMMLIVISSFVVGLGNFTTVYAAPKAQMTDGGGTGSSKECGALGSTTDKNTFAYYLQMLFDIVKFLGPALVLIMTIIDLVKITAEQKQDEDFKKLGGKTLKRFIYAALIFTLPSLIGYLLGIFGIIGYGTCVM